MRKYRVTLTSPIVGTMQHFPAAVSYQDAEAKAAYWADNHAEHGKYGPWTPSDAEVAA